MSNNPPPFGFGPFDSGSNNFGNNSGNSPFNMPFNPASFGKNPNGNLINAEQVRFVAKQILSSQKNDFVGNRDIEDFSSALAIADTWLDGVTLFPTTTVPTGCVWSARDWLESCVKSWQELFEPLAQGLANALVENVSQLTNPDSVEMQGLEAMGINPEFLNAPQFIEQIKEMMKMFMGAIIGNQLGQSIGQLSLSITGSLDVGIPMSTAHLIPANVKVWGEGLGLREDEIRIFLSLRESAAARLFAHSPWLYQYIKELIIEYGRGIQIDIEKIREQAESALLSGEIDPSRPDNLNIAINAGLFTPEKTPRQEKALEKIELIFALIDGWIDHVTAQAAGERLPSFNLLNETHRRARAISSPVQKLFQSLLGLEVSPKLTREATSFWNSVYELKGKEVRDGRWEEPALLPTVADLSDAQKFLNSFEVPDDLSGLI